MKRKKFKLSDAELAQVKAAVKSAEAKTSGEIVPFIVSESDNYWWVHGFWAGFGWLLVTTIFCLLVYQHGEAFSLTRLIFFQTVGILLGLCVPVIPAIKRLCIPTAIRAHNVHREVLASFMGAGLSQTKHRTGVLLYLSVLERRVEILADQGIHAKLSNQYWQNHVDRIVKGIHSGTPVKVICEVITHIGEELALSFPRSADDVNELSDEIHLAPED